MTPRTRPRCWLEPPPPILAPETEDETSGILPHVVFPTVNEEIDGIHHALPGDRSAPIGCATTYPTKKETRSCTASRTPR